MIETQFFLQNLHFALGLFAALIFFAAAWLYFDAWTIKKNKKDGLKILGFLALCLSFVVSSTHIEQTILQNSALNQTFILNASFILRVFGYLTLCLGLQIDPLQKRPSAPALVGVGIGSLISIATPILAALAGLLYLKRATKGLENHLKPVALSFFLFALYELLSLASLFQNTNNITIYNIVAPFAPLWIITHVILLLATFVLGRWVFAYLLKRLQTQLFMIFTSLILIIFLLTTVSFTYLLLRNLENDALSHLTTDVNILSYSIESKKTELLSDAEVVSHSPTLQKAITDADKKTLKEIALRNLSTKKASSLIITSADGTVLMRGEDTERLGDSLSSDSLFRKAAGGNNLTSVIVRDGVLAPTVSLRAASAVVDDSNKVIGTVIIGTDIDNSYVDGIKRATGLDASIYGGNKRSATTFVSADQKSRWIGISEDNSVIKKTVLVDGKPFIGTSDILNIPYLSAFLPLKDIDKVPVGMLFVGREKLEILQTAGRSIELTFFVSAILLVFSIIPAFFVAKYISGQVK